MFAIRFGSKDVLFSDNLTPQSRVLYYRRVQERVRKIAPFLTYENDRYLSISEGGGTGCRTRTPSARDIRIHGGPRRGAELHPQLDQGDGGRLSRPHAVLPGRSDRPRGPHIGQGVPGGPTPVVRDARRPAVAAAVSPGHLPAPGADVLDLPHDQPGHLLQQGGPVGGPGAGNADRRNLGDAALLHRHAAAGRNADRVHPDAAAHAAAEGQPGRLDGRAKRRRELRQADGVPVPEAEGRVRAAPGRGAYQPGSGDLAADHALEPAGVGSHPRQPARHPDRGIPALHPAALPAFGRWKDPRTQAHHRRVSEPDRDGEHPGRCDRQDFRPEGGAKPVLGMSTPSTLPMTPAPVPPPGAELPPAPAAAPTLGVPTLATIPPAPPPDATLERLSAEARATYDRAIASQREGNWARYGEELTRLGEILDRIAKLSAKR